MAIPLPPPHRELDSGCASPHLGTGSFHSWLPLLSHSPTFERPLLGRVSRYLHVVACTQTSPGPHLQSCQRCCLSNTTSSPEAINGDSAFKARPWGSWIETQISQQFLDHRYHDPKSSILALSVWPCTHQMGDLPDSWSPCCPRRGWGGCHCL